VGLDGAQNKVLQHRLSVQQVVGVLIIPLRVLVVQRATLRTLIINGIVRLELVETALMESVSAIQQILGRLRIVLVPADRALVIVRKTEIELVDSGIITLLTTASSETVCKVT